MLPRYILPLLRQHGSREKSFAFREEYSKLSAQPSTHVMVAAQIHERMLTSREPSPGGRKRLSLIQMVLLRHLKAGFEKKDNCRCDCDGYRPDTFEIEIRPLGWYA